MGRENDLRLSCFHRGAEFLDEQMDRAGIQSVFDLFDNQERGRIWVAQTGQQPEDS